ncbi:MAG: ABC transporter permease [Rhizobiales bacterium]|nr:ABC transporter permease [Hyphomicrobiales bacterium]
MEDWKRNGRAFWTLGSPATFWLVVFFLAPLAYLLVLSFSSKAVIDGQVSVNDYAYLTGIDNYVRTLNPDIISIFLRTLWWSALATIACLLVGYPIAFAICFMPERWRPLALLLIVLPFWINLLIRTYALKTVLGARGLVGGSLNAILEPFGMQADIIGTTPAVIFGLVYVFLPFMILPLYSTIERLDKSYLEASLDLGASQFQTFYKVTLPLTMPGIVTGLILVFIPCLGMFLISDELGGTTSWMIGNVIQSQFGSSNDWPFGSALSFVLMLLTIIVLFIQWYVQNHSKGVGAQ